MRARSGGFALDFFFVCACNIFASITRLRGGFESHRPVPQRKSLPLQFTFPFRREHPPLYTIPGTPEYMLYLGYAIYRYRPLPLFEAPLWFRRSLLSWLSGSEKRRRREATTQAARTPFILTKVPFMCHVLGSTRTAI